jgi:hypothetical protein
MSPDINSIKFIVNEITDKNMQISKKPIKEEPEPKSVYDTIEYREGSPYGNS